MSFNRPKSWWEQEKDENRENIVISDAVLNEFWQTRILNKIKNGKSKEEIFQGTIGIRNFFLKRSNRPNNEMGKEAWEKKIDEEVLAAISLTLEGKELQGKEQFLTLFKHIPSQSIIDIDEPEELGILKRFNLPVLQPKPDVVIDKQDGQKIESYMIDRNMSATVSIGSAQSKGLITLSSQNNQTTNAFAMHSVGKLFAEILPLILVRKEIISEAVLKDEPKMPIEINEEIKKSLPPEVITHLENKEVTLHRAMTHQAGFGDYLPKYNEKIKEARIEEKHLPEINQIKDFLPFAFPKDQKFIEHTIGEKNYSNTGLVLVGLAIEHAYDKNREKDNTPIIDHYNGDLYHNLVRKFIIDEVGMTSFSLKMPLETNHKFNLEDKNAPDIIAGPAGGYWLTVEDLAKFGKWLYELCKDPEMKRLIETYGQEFYKDGVISHEGGGPYASAYLSVDLRSGAIVAVLSNEGNGAASILAKAIIKNVFSEKRETKIEHTEQKQHDIVKPPKFAKKDAPSLNQSRLFTSQQKSTKRKESYEDEVKFTKDEMKSAFAQGSYTAKEIARKKR